MRRVEGKVGPSAVTRRLPLGGALLLGALTASACTRINPGFIDNARNSAASADDEAGSDDSEDSFDSGVTTVDDSVGSSSSGADTGSPECELAWTNSLKFRYIADLEGDACAAQLDRYFVVRDASIAGGLVVDPCGPGCGDGCDDSGTTEIEVFPVNLSDAAADLEGVCVRARYEGLNEALAERCTYDKFFLTAEPGPSIPLVVGSARDGATPDFAVEVLGGFEPQIVLEEGCVCAGADPCCDASDPPGQFAFVIDDGPPATVGSETPVSLGGRQFDFFAVQAQQKDSCGEPLELSWLLVAN